ncbi:hypothetical protein D3C87_1831390 [compost metagenome]
MTASRRISARRCFRCSGVGNMICVSVRASEMRMIAGAVARNPCCRSGLMTTHVTGRSTAKMPAAIISAKLASRA